MLKDTKETMKSINLGNEGGKSQQIENINRELIENINKQTEIMKREPNRNSETASTITEMKSSLEVFNSRLSRQKTQ